MKARVYWIFLATSLAPMAIFAQSLNPSDGFSGGGTFVPKVTTDTTGTIYSLNGGICISDIKQAPTGATACFKEDKGSLCFLGNGFDLAFKDIDMSAIQDAWTGSPIVSLIDFSSLGFNNTAGIGAVHSDGCVNLLNNKSVTFELCSFTTPATTPPGVVGGGAISCRGCVISGVQETVSFVSNTSDNAGGAIDSAVAGALGTKDRDSATKIEGNRSVLFSSNNSAKNGGGAVFSALDMKINGNQQVVFYGNVAESGSAGGLKQDGCGGALCCINTRNNNPEDRSLIIENNKSVLFQGNKAAKQGGAIYASKLVLSAGGDVRFSDNLVEADPAATQSPGKGGAIAVEKECSISADKGNIIFNGNKVGTRRNALDVTGATAGAFSALRAKYGYGVYFYDPVISKGTGDFEWNKTDAGEQFQGKIVFSGKTLTDEEKTNPENAKSEFDENIILVAGTLQLRSGVHVKAAKFTQKKDASLIMDVGTTLESKGTFTPGTAPNPGTGGEVTVGTLSVNTDSLADVAEGTSVEIVATGNVEVANVDFVSDEESGYESPIFGESKDYDLITISPSGTPAPTQTTVTLPTEDIEVTPAEHYGYQGTWSLPKVTPPTNLTTPVTLTASWKFNKYDPHPERQGGLVPNTLWGAFSDMRVVQDVMKRAPSHETDRQGLWGAGLGSFLRTSSSKTARQFAHNSGGYLLGFTTRPICDDIFSLGFYSMYAREKDYLVMKNHATILGGSLYYQHGLSPDVGSKLLSTMGSEDPLVMHILFSYNHASNSERTTVTSNIAPNLTAPQELEGAWGNDCFSIEVGAFATLDVHNVYLQQIFDLCHPFVNCQLVYAHQGDFEETGAPKGRAFETSSLTNVSLPLGIILESGSFGENGFTIELTYSPDLYRENPKVKIASLDDPSHAQWETKGTNLARQALSVSIGQHMIATPNLEVFANGGFEIRGSSRAYSADVRGQYKF